MRVGVEEAVLEDHLDDDADRLAGEAGSARAVGHRLLNLLAVEELLGEHLLGARVPVDRGEPDAWVAGEVPREAVGVVGLDDEVELARDRLVELLHERDGRVDAGLRHGALERGREQVQDLEVAGDGIGHPGTLHLDDDVDPPVGGREDGLVHLADRRGRERRLVDALVDVRDAGAEARLDDVLDRFESDPGDLVLELLQLEDERLGEDVLARGEDLAELDEGRAEVLEHEAHPLGARDVLLLVLAVDVLGGGDVDAVRRGRERRRGDARPGLAAAEADAGHDLAEAVADEDRRESRADGRDHGRR